MLTVQKQKHILWVKWRNYVEPKNPGGKLRGRGVTYCVNRYLLFGPPDRWQIRGAICWLFDVVFLILHITAPVLGRQDVGKGNYDCMWDQNSQNFCLYHSMGVGTTPNNLTGRAQSPILSTVGSSMQEITLFWAKFPRGIPPDLPSMRATTFGPPWY